MLVLILCDHIYKIDLFKGSNSHDLQTSKILIYDYLRICACSVVFSYNHSVQFNSLAIFCKIFDFKPSLHLTMNYYLSIHMYISHVSYLLSFSNI